MPSPSRSTLDDTHVGAVVLVPLHDDAARHGGRLERDDGIELALADHHAAGMLPQMAWQILDPAPQLRERPHPRPVERQAGRLSVAPERLVRIGELEVVHRLPPAGRSRRRPATAPYRRRARALRLRYVITLAVIAAPRRPYFSYTC